MLKRLREKLRRKWKELIGQGRVPTPDKYRTKFVNVRIKDGQIKKKEQ